MYLWLLPASWRAAGAPAPVPLPLHEDHGGRAAASVARGRRTVRPPRYDRHQPARADRDEPPVAPRHPERHRHVGPARARVRHPRALRAVHPGGVARRAHAGRPGRRSEARPARGAGAVREAAPRQKHGLILFPEGHRSRDGELQPFKTAGAQALLGAHPMPVHMVVTDGVWIARRFVDFLFNIHLLRVRTEVLGPFEPPAEPRRRSGVPAGPARAHGGTPRAHEGRCARLTRSARPSGRGWPPRHRTPAPARPPHAVEDRGGSATRAIVFFGSRKTQARPDAWSAYDFFVVVDRYRPFYDGAARARSAAPPERPGGGAQRAAAAQPDRADPGCSGRADGPRAKCAVVSSAAFARETSPARRDHFFLGRLFQPTEVVFAADEASREQAVDALASAHALTYAWVRPWLPDALRRRGRSAARCCACPTRRRSGRSRTDARTRCGRRSATTWRPVYGVLLHELHAAGELVLHEPGIYGLARPARQGRAAAPVRVLPAVEGPGHPRAGPSTS